MAEVRGSLGLLSLGTVQPLADDALHLLGWDTRDAVLQEFMKVQGQCCPYPRLSVISVSASLALPVAASGLPRISVFTRAFYAVA